MAFFKFRKGGDEQPAPPIQPESIEALRKRARHRLVGAAVLVLAGVLGFPLLFDNQPRPISVDIPIEIPDKNKTRPISVLVAPTLPAPEPPAASTAPVPAPMITESKEPAVTPKAQEKVAVAREKPALDATKSIAITDAKVDVKIDAKVGAKSQPGADDGAKAQALLEGKPLEKPASASDGRFVVQVGAFADATHAKEARTKLERAGLKTYITVVETKDGQRTRVRVGPFSGKADADKAANKIKALDLPAAILTL